MDDSARRQLEALRDVAGALDESGIWYVLFGGWAVDLHAGAVTRPHDDVDLAVWLDDRPQIAALMEGAGWQHAPHPGEDGGTGYERDGVRVEFTFLVEQERGIVLPMRAGPVPWPYEHPDGRRELHGVSVPVVSLATLRAGKSVERGGPSDIAKDRADLDALGRLAE